jgi:hypothetical protein
MVEPRVVGSFRAAGGSGNDIKVLIMDPLNYENWANGHSVKVNYTSGQITVANIDVALPSGTYYLVYSNRFSTFSSKSINTKVDLVYKEYR